MKEFKKYWFNIRVLVDGGNYLCGGCHYEDPEDAARDAWRAALEHYNKLFLDGMHPQDVIFEMQKELENE